MKAHSMFKYQLKLLVKKPFRHWSPQEKLLSIMISLEVFILFLLIGIGRSIGFDVFVVLNMIIDTAFLCYFARLLDKARCKRRLRGIGDFEVQTV